MDNPQYTNPGGTGDRQSSIATSCSSIGVGTISALVDGLQADGSLYLNNVARDHFITFDFGVGASKVITEATWYQGGTNTHGDWIWRGSQDGASWKILSDAFVLGGSAAQVINALSGNTTGWRYYQLFTLNAAADTGPWIREIEFKIDDASTPGEYTKVVVPSYVNLGGVGDRQAIISVSVSGLPTWGEPSALVNGNYNDTLFVWWGINGLLTFDFGVGASKVITEATWYQGGTNEHGDWQWRGSDDNATWTNIGSPFTLGGSAAQVITAPSANTTGYRYYQLQQVSGSASSGPWLNEIRFKIADAAPLSATASETAHDSTTASLSCSVEGGHSPYTYQWFRETKANGSPSGGTWTITYDGSETSGIPWNCNPSDVNAALATLPGNSEFAIVAALETGTWPTQGGYYQLVFAIGLGNVAEVTVTSHLTGGNEVMLTVSTIVEGETDVTEEQQRITLTFTPGTALDGETSATLDDTGLSPSTDYYYVCRVIDAVDTTAWSNEVMVTTDARPPVVVDDNFSNEVPFDIGELIGTVQATGGTSPYTWEIVSQTLRGP